MASYESFQLVDRERVRIIWSNDVLDDLEGLGPTASQDDSSLLCFFGDAICSEIEFRTFDV